jgi:hypothetical protein
MKHGGCADRALLLCCKSTREVPQWLSLYAGPTVIAVAGVSLRALTCTFDVIIILYLIFIYFFDARAHRYYLQ